MMKKKKKYVLTTCLTTCLTVCMLLFFPFCKAKRVVNPNIVLIVVDTLRRDHLRLYNEESRGMPFLEELARKGIVFKDYLSTSSHTIPSHFSIFSSKLPSLDTLKIESSFVEQLKNKGYRTYGISANPLVNTSYAFNLGFDYFDADIHKKWGETETVLRNYMRFEEKSPVKNELNAFLMIHLSTTADIVNQEISGLFQNHGQSEDPFFLFINFLDPHEPYFPYGDEAIRVNYNIRDKESTLHEFIKKCPSLSDQEISELRALYSGEIEYLDGQLIRFVQELKKRGLYENTVFIFTSDHGELLGEHGLFTHDLGLYDEEIDVPFILFGHGVSQGSVHEQFSHLDTGEIVLSLADNSLNKVLDRLKKKNEDKSHLHVGAHFFYDPNEKEYRRNSEHYPLLARYNLIRLSSAQKTVFLVNDKPDGYIIQVYNRADRLLNFDLFPDMPKDERLYYVDLLRRHRSQFKANWSVGEEELKFLQTLGYAN